MNTRFKKNKNLLFVFLIGSLITVTSCDNDSNTDTNTIVEKGKPVFSADALQILELVNEERSLNGLNTLVLNSVLIDTAIKHCMDMKDNIGGLDHKGSDGSDFIERCKRSNYKGFSRAENIARGQTSAKQVYEAWMKSPAHRKNILLSDVTEMGIGRYDNYWTQIFGRN